MEKSFLSVEVLGDNTKIICDDAIYLVPTNIINQIAELTDTDEEAMDLYAYVKTRMEGYNQSLELTNRTDIPRGDLSPIMIKDLLVALLSCFTYEVVIDMLDRVKDYDLFSVISLLEGVSTSDAIGFLVSFIKDAHEIGGYYAATDEEDKFNNQNDRCSEIYLRRVLEERDAEIVETIGTISHENSELILENLDDSTLYGEKVEALTTMGLEKMSDDEAQILGLNPICK